MATVELKNVNKIYDNNVQAVFDFNLKIKDKEFIVFVGPSGCGKTTTLRMIAGLEEISSGELYINDVLMNDVAPKDREIAMVFQSYALYPHMTVYNNMAFGLKLRKFSRDEIDRRVKSAAEKLGLTPYLDRKPKALSGGQRQRVALGRAIVRDAKVFLMDEPLSNLDAKLRVQMRSELIKLHESLGTTTIYVTHDQIEAMTMASRIVVMKDGWIQQIGAPKDIYDYPVNVFVGGFIGTPPMNFITGVVKEEGYFECGNHKYGVVRLNIPEKKFNLLKELGYVGHTVILGIRAEDIHDIETEAREFTDNILELKIDVAELLGSDSQITVKLPGTDAEGQNVVAKIDARGDIHMGDTIKLAFNMEKCHFFDVDTEKRIVEGGDKHVEKEVEETPVVEEEVVIEEEVIETEKETNE